MNTKHQKILVTGDSFTFGAQVSNNETWPAYLENISKITGDYFLFEGSDSTSLMGGYEVFNKSVSSLCFLLVVVRCYSFVL